MKKILQALLGCGCLVALVVVVGGYFAYQRFSSTVIIGNEKVTAFTQTLCPGAEVPKGYNGFLGVNTEPLKMSMLAPEGDKSDTMIAIMAMPLDKDAQKLSREDWNKALRDKVDEQKQKKHQKVLSESQEEVQVGGHSMTASRTTVEGEHGKEVEELILARHPSNPQIIGIFFEGPEGGFPKDVRDGFLSKLQLEPLAKDEPAAGKTPAAEETPAASKTPEDKTATPDAENSTPEKGDEE